MNLEKLVDRLRDGDTQSNLVLRELHDQAREAVVGELVAIVEVDAAGRLGLEVEGLIEETERLLEDLEEQHKIARGEFERANEEVIQAQAAFEVARLRTIGQVVGQAERDAKARAHDQVREAGKRAAEWRAQRGTCASEIVAKGKCLKRLQSLRAGLAAVTLPPLEALPIVARVLEEIREGALAAG